MIALKLLFQSLAGVGSIAVCAGGGYYVLNSGETIPSENIIVLFTPSTTTTNADTTPKDGYICEVTTSTENATTKSAEDTSCQIYSLSTSTPSTSIDFSDIFSKAENKVSGNLTASNKYILTISKTTFDSVTGTDKSIEIFNKKTPKSSLIKFSPKVTLEGSAADPKPNLIFAQAFKLPTTSITESLGSDKKYFCEFLESTSTSKFECDIYKSDTTGNEFTDTQFAAVTKSTTASDITKAKYFVIDLKSQTLSKSQLRNKKIKLSIGTSSSSITEVATFLYEQSLVGDVSSESKFIYRISPSREIYYVVQVGAKGAATSPELETAADGDAVQNYKCKLDDAEDATCKLFTLPAFSTSKNSVTHDEVLTAKTSAKIENLTDGAYFKISLNPSNIDSLKWDGSAEKTITIVSTAQTSQTYATLKIVAKEEKEKIIGKTSLVVGKIKALTPGNVSTITCSLSTGASQACSAFTFATEPTAQQTSKDLIFGTVTATTTLATTDEGKYLLLDLKGQSAEFEELKTKEVEVSVTSGSTTTKFTLTSLTPLVGELSATATSNKVIFLSK